MLWASFAELLFRNPRCCSKPDVDIGTVITVSNAERVEFRIRLRYGLRENLTIETLLALHIHHHLPMLLELYRLVFLYQPVNQNYLHYASFSAIMSEVLFLRSLPVNVPSGVGSSRRRERR